MKYVLAWGSAFDGINLIGPFNDAGDATTYAVTDPEINRSEWHVILLQKPAN